MLMLINVNHVIVFIRQLQQLLSGNIACIHVMTSTWTVEPLVNFFFYFAGDCACVVLSVNLLKNSSNF